MSRKPHKNVAPAPKRVVCPYCDRDAERVTGKALYPHRPDLFGKHFYRCAPCGAHVGCHPNSFTPLGRLADAKLRKMKSAAHAAFDPIWKSGRMSRADAYAWLAEQIGVARQNCHIGMFDVDQCQRVIAACGEIA